MKKIILFILLLSLTINLFASEVLEKKQKAPDMEIDFHFYLPSWLGVVTGHSSVMGMRQNYDIIDDCIVYMIESRGSIKQVKNTVFSWSFGGGGYIENNKKIDDYMSFDISLGFGVYFPYDMNYLLSGFCIYFYPMYQVPIYTEGESYFKWKNAIDIGYNFVIFNALSVYSYIRNMVAYNGHDCRYMIDFGIAIGLYFDDRESTQRILNQESWKVCSSL